MKPRDLAIISIVTLRPHNLITLNSANSCQFPPTRFHAFVSLHCQQNKKQMNSKEKLSIAESAPLKAAKYAISQRKPTHFATQSYAHHKPKWHTLRGFGINKERAQTCMRFALSHLILLAPSPYRTENAGRGVIT